MLNGPNFAFTDPYFHADLTVDRCSFRMRIIDISTQRVKRDTAFLYCSVRAISAPPRRPPHFTTDPFSTHSHCSGDRLFHCTAESDTAFQLRCDILCYQLSIKFRTLHFADEDLHFLVRYFLQLFLELPDLFPLLPMTTPGREVLMVIRAFFGVRSIKILETPAFFRRLRR
jgi:hypothetical protein